MYEHSPVLTKYKQCGIHYKEQSKRNLSPAGGVTFNVGAGQDECRRDRGEGGPDPGTKNPPTAGERSGASAPN